MPTCASAPVAAAAAVAEVDSTVDAVVPETVAVSVNTAFLALLRIFLMDSESCLCVRGRLVLAPVLQQREKGVAEVENRDEPQDWAGHGS